VPHYVNPSPIIIVEVQRPPSDQAATVELERQNVTNFSTCKNAIATRIVEIRVIDDPAEFEADL
jgi:hypothetical protein